MSGQGASHPRRQKTSWMTVHCSSPSRQFAAGGGEMSVQLRGPRASRLRAPPRSLATAPQRACAEPLDGACGWTRPVRGDPTLRVSMHTDSAAYRRCAVSRPASRPSFEGGRNGKRRFIFTTNRNPVKYPAFCERIKVCSLGRAARQTQLRLLEHNERQVQE